MLGDGKTQGSPVSRNPMPRRQPRHATTESSRSSRRSARNSLASSPTVMPWRTARSCSPQKLSNPGRSAGPSTSAPPSGFGRSSTRNALRAATDAVLGAEQERQRDPRRRREEIGGVDERAVHGGRIADEPDALAAQG